MSGPFGVRITVISGQKCSREIVVAASTFLSRTFLTIDPVAADVSLRQEFLAALNTFGSLERIDYYQGPWCFAGKVIQPSNTISTGDLFWLALDKEGESLARDIFEANGESLDKRVYHAVRKLNLIEPIIPPPPHRKPFWQKLFSARPRQPEPGPMPSYQAYRKKLPWITPQQAQYYAWFEALYEALIPWQDIIRNIQSDYS